MIYISQLIVRESRSWFLYDVWAALLLSVFTFLLFALRPFEFATTVLAGHGQATSIRCGKICSSLLTQKLYKEIAL